MKQFPVYPISSQAGLYLLPLLWLPAQAATQTPEVQQLSTVQVSGTPQSTGKSQEGYRVSEVNLGPLGNKKALDRKRP